MTDSGRPVLVLGGGGYLGRAVVAHLARSGRVEAPPRAELDVTDGAAVRRRVRDLRPRAVVNLAAAHGSDSLDTTNVDGASHVARAAAGVGARLVHVSSDVVLDGRHAPYDDDAEPAPVSAYGRSKAAGERVVRESGADAVIVRTSLIWDPSEIDRGTGGFARRLAHGETCRLFTDELRCPVTRATLACAIRALLEQRYTGTLNVAGDEALSRHEFGVLLLAHFDVPGRERVEACRAAEFRVPPGEVRPADLTLDVSRAAALLGLGMTGVRAALGAHPGAPIRTSGVHRGRPPR